MSIPFQSRSTTEMRLNSLTLLLCMLTSLPALAQPDSGSLGDVRYSVLPPANFRNLNGDGWQLMDGRNINGSDLCTEFGTCQIPDARGVFIRGMNVGRDQASGDPEGNRGVGSYQSDNIESHTHGLHHRIIGDTRGGFTHGVAAGGGSGSIHDIGIRTTDAKGGNETRPRNIALYVYIKVNQ